MPESRANKRKRGIIASRRKIEQAMLASGIPTQLELAKRIVQIDPDVQTPPKDMISRVMRGNAVDSKNIERIAKALNVDSYTLYANSDDHSIGESTIELQNSSQISITHTKLITFSAILILVLFIITLLMLIFINVSGIKKNDDAQKLDNYISPLTSTSFPIKTAVVGLEELVNLSSSQSSVSDFINELNSELSTQYKFQNSKLSILSKSNEPWELNSKLSTELTLVFSTKVKGRYFSIFVEAYSQKQKQLIFADVFHIDSLTQGMSPLRELLNGALVELVSSSVSDNKLYVPSPQAVSLTLDGAQFLDQPLQANIISLGLTALNRAISISPQYPTANAYLCRGLTEMYVVQSDENILQQAKSACKQSSNPNQTFNYLLASANLYRKTGKVEEAIDLINNALSMNPNAVDALIEKAEIFIQRGIQNRDINEFQQALSATQLAVQLAPNFWKPNFVLGRVYYYMGEPSKAIEATSRSVEIDANISNLSNLATQHFCFDDPKVAKSLYIQALEMPFVRPVLHYNLAAVLSFLQEYKQAADVIDNYISLLQDESSQPQLEGLIGAADIYRLAEQVEKAEKYYLLAYEEAEKLSLIDSNNPKIQMQLVYIDISLAFLRKKMLTDKEYTDFSKKLDLLEPKALSADAILVMMFSNLALKREDKVQALYNILAPYCKGYADAPELKKYKANLSKEI